MSNKINDGGPAFPHLRRHISDNTYIPLAEGGMSLRDWFAGHCPLKFEDSANSYGFLSIKFLMQDDHRQAFFQFDAEARMEWADAMLAAREEGGK
jgi:hypothetical protein